MTHICVGNLTSIGPDNGLSPGRRKPLPEPMQECCKLIGSELYVSDNYAINGSVSGLVEV